MINAVELLLRDVTAAVAARQLYTPDHPRCRDILERAVQRATEITAALGEVSVFQLDTRLVWQGAPLPNGESLARGFFSVLHAQGFHRWSLTAGVTADELGEFVTQVAELTRVPDAARLRPSAHVRLSSIDAPTARPDSPGKFAVSSEEQGALVGMWRGVLDERKLQFDSLEVMALALARTLQRHSGALIPLATLKSRDDYTVSHITNVALLGMALAEAISLPPALVRDVGNAILLHDVGKLRVPEDVLNAPGRLNERQRALIRRHPEDGARMLMGTPGVSDLAVAVAYEHHVQFDGGGYPTLATGWKVNLVSAITHLVDVYDALRCDRPYRPGLPRDAIVELMARDAGTVFDPGLIDVFFQQVVPRTTDVDASAPPGDGTGAPEQR